LASTRARIVTSVVRRVYLTALRTTLLSAERIRRRSTWSVTSASAVTDSWTSRPSA
jgi:hypothetical protein